MRWISSDPGGVDRLLRFETVNKSGTASANVIKFSDEDNMSMVFLRDDLDAENIRDGNTLPVRHLDHAVDRVDPLDLSGDSLVAAAVLPFIRHKVGDGRRGPAGKQLLEALQFRVHTRLFVLIRFHALVRQPPGFRNGGAAAGQGGKG